MGNPLRWHRWPTGITAQSWTVNRSNAKEAEKVPPASRRFNFHPSRAEAAALAPQEMRATSASECQVGGGGFISQLPLLRTEQPVMHSGRTESGQYVHIKEEEDDKKGG